MLRRIQTLLLCVMVLPSTISCSHPDARSADPRHWQQAGACELDGEHTDALEEAIRALLTIACTDESMARLDLEERNTVWADRIYQAREAMLEYERSANVTLLCAVVRELGRHGPEVDLLILFSLPPARGSYCHGPVSDETEEYYFSRFGHSYRSLQASVARCMVERCLADQAYLERYYAAVLWSREMALQNVYGMTRSVDEIQDAFLSADENRYWWHARDFLLWAKATDRLDLIEGFGATELREPFERWCEWLRESLDRLSPNQESTGWRLTSESAESPRHSFPSPDTPFDDWPWGELTPGIHDSIDSCLMF